MPSSVNTLCNQSRDNGKVSTPACVISDQGLLLQDNDGIQVEAETVIALSRLHTSEQKRWDFNYESNITMLNFQLTLKYYPVHQLHGFVLPSTGQTQSSSTRWRNSRQSWALSSGVVPICVNPRRLFACSSVHSWKRRSWFLLTQSV